MLLLHSCDSWSLGSCCCESCVQGPRSHNAATLFAQPHGTHFSPHPPTPGEAGAVVWGGAACYTRLQLERLLLVADGRLLYALAIHGTTVTWRMAAFTRLGGSTRTLGTKLTLFASYSLRSPLGLPYVRLAYLSAWLKLQACAAPHVAMPH